VLPNFVFEIIHFLQKKKKENPTLKLCCAGVSGTQKMKYTHAFRQFNKPNVVCVLWKKENNIGFER